MHKSKKKGLIIPIVVLVSMVLFAGCSKEETSVPVYENTTDYIKVTFPELIQNSAYIFVGEVVDVGESYVQEAHKDSLADAPEGATVLAPLCTPVTLKVKEGIKGVEAGDEFVFYMDGGVTDKYAIKVSGHEFETGMEAVLLLTPNKFSWGGQGEFLVEGENVILKPAILEYLGGEKITTAEAATMRVDDFIGEIKSIMSGATSGEESKEPESLESEAKEESSVAESSEEAEEVITTVSIEGMSIEEFLATCGMEEYISEYINLKPVEDITYVPHEYSISIYYKNMLCGSLSRMVYMAQKDWDKNRHSASRVTHGPRTLYDEMDISGMEDVPYLVLMNCRRDELYGSPGDKEWFWENGYAQSKEDADIETCEYEVLYGRGDYLYAYQMSLSPYFVDEELLEKMVRAVTFTDKSFTDNTSLTKYSTIQRTGTLDVGPTAYGALKSLDFPDERWDFRYFFRVGDTVYDVPEGTVAVESESGWELYALVGWSLARIGTIDLIAVENYGDSVSKEDIAKQYIGADYQKENLVLTDSGFEYSVTVDSIRKHYVFDGKGAEMLVAEYFTIK